MLVDCPSLYGRGTMGYSPGWVRMAKHSIASLMPRFNSTRMAGEYVTRFYVPASRQGAQYADGGHAIARTIAQWKTRVRQAWHGVTVRRLDSPVKRIQFGDSLHTELAVMPWRRSPALTVITVTPPARWPRVRR